MLETNPNFFQRNKKAIAIIVTVVTAIIIAIILVIIFKYVLKKDCEVSEWTNWGDCVNGKTKRTRTITKLPEYGGKECPSLTEDKDCNDCEVSEWTDWSACVDKNSNRTRTVTKAAVHGKPCPNLIEDRECADCEVSEWTEWSACIDGKSNRTRTVINPPRNGGKECPSLTENRACNDCEVSDWGNWSECVDNKSNRNRTITKPAVYGKECPVLTEDRECADCEVSEWTDWGECLNGKSVKTRTITTHSLNGGKECPSLTENRDCNDCEVSEWTDWSDCIDGKSVKNRTIIKPSIYGKECPLLTEYEECLYKVTEYNKTFYLEVCATPVCISGPGTGAGYAHLTPGVYSGRRLAAHFETVLNNFYKSNFNPKDTDNWNVTFNDNNKTITIKLNSSRSDLNIIWNKVGRKLNFVDFMGLRNFVNQKRAISPEIPLVSDPLISNLNAPDVMVPNNFTINETNNRYIAVVQKINFDMTPGNKNNMLLAVQAAPKIFTGYLPTGTFTPVEIASNFGNSFNTLFKKQFNADFNLLSAAYDDTRGVMQIKIQPNFKLWFHSSSAGATANFILGLENKTVEKDKVNNIFMHKKGYLVTDQLMERFTGSRLVSIQPYI